MKPALLIPLLAVGAISCAVDEESPIRILGAKALDGSCVAESIEQYRGSLDISASGSYLLSFSLESNLEPISTKVNGTEVAGPERNDFILEEIVHTYSSTPVIAFDTERVSAYSVVRAGAADSSFINVDLIAPKAYDKLIANVAPGSSIELIATVQLIGRLASGADVETNAVSYPIRVYNSGFTGCAPGTSLKLTGPCGNPGGQDGAEVVCE